jgi:hypothetical protein
MFSEFFGRYVHSRKRFDRFTRMLTSGILNIGQDSRPPIRISRLSWPKACTVCSVWRNAVLASHQTHRHPGAKVSSTIRTFSDAVHHRRH